MLKKWTAPVSAPQLTVSLFPMFPLICTLWSPTGVPPLPRTIITLVCDPRREAGREMNSHVGLQGKEYYFVWTNAACSSPRSFTSSDWCWQFPQTKLCYSEPWSMALISQILTSIKPRSNLFLPTTTNSWCSYSSSKTTFLPNHLHPLFNSSRYLIYIRSKHNFSRSSERLSPDWLCF